MYLYIINYPSYLAHKILFTLLFFSIFRLESFNLSVNVVSFFYEKIYFLTYEFILNYDLIFYI